MRAKDEKASKRSKRCEKWIMVGRFTDYPKVTISYQLAISVY